MSSMCGCPQLPWAWEKCKKIHGVLPHFTGKKWRLQEACGLAKVPKAMQPTLCTQSPLLHPKGVFC